MSRLSIYAGQRGGLTEFRKHLPAVVAGAWRAPDGDRAIALASIADHPVKFALSLQSEYSVWRIDHSGVKRDFYRAGTSKFWRIDESGRKLIDRNRLDRLIQVELPPRGACLIELTPD